ncbi:hypothetical protein AUF78_07450 [archaeon 13_1_20CM_2_51_12]|nr:MAG: hypothetical protein AUF78_07450 [archaeon 13_1_20CM_2_51_12]
MAKNSLPRTAIAAVLPSHDAHPGMGRAHQRNSTSPPSRSVCDMRAEPTVNHQNAENELKAVKITPRTIMIIKSDDQDPGSAMGCLCSDALVLTA